MTGLAYAEAAVRTVSDLRELVHWCDRHNVNGKVEVDWSQGKVFLDIVPNAPADWIMCGNHYADEGDFYDVVVLTHEESHESEDPNQIPIFDWPSKDRLNRYSDEARPE